MREPVWLGNQGAGPDAATSATESGDSERTVDGETDGARKQHHQGTSNDRQDRPNTRPIRGLKEQASLRCEQEQQRAVQRRLNA